MVGLDAVRGGVVQAFGAVGAVAGATWRCGSPGSTVAGFGVVLGGGAQPEPGGDGTGEVGVVAQLVEAGATDRMPGSAEDGAKGVGVDDIGQSQVG